MPVRALAFDTIYRILDRAESTGSVTDYVPTEDSPVSSTKVKGPPSLPPNIVAALEKAKRDNAWIDGSKHVLLQPDDVTKLSGWCRAHGLDNDATAVDAAFR